MESSTGEKDFIKNKTIENVIYMAIVAVVTFFSSFLRKYGFQVLGFTVTQKVRKSLYVRILRKNIGWFDDRDHSSGVLTSVMAEDTSLVNGAGSESLAPTIEAMFAMIVGIAIGFYYCWQMALTCLLVSPVLMVGNIIEMKLA